MLDLNAGYNGSENFAPDKRFGFFPAASVGWTLSEEKFMKKQKVIDFLKLRASYGIVGNDKMENARFLYLSGSWNGYNTVKKNQEAGSSDRKAVRLCCRMQRRIRWAIRM